MHRTQRQINFNQVWYSGRGFRVHRQRIVGYDNERGKGEHRHLRSAEKPYRFMDVATLLDDFMRDVEAAKWPL